MRKVLVMAAAAGLAGCGAAQSSSGEEYGGSPGSGSYGREADAEETREPFDEALARDRAEEEVADDGYQGPCTMDCSGHDAGFGWAAEGHQDYGMSRSRSFDEGQIAYEDAVEDRVEEMREAYAGE